MTNRPEAQIRLVYFDPESAGYHSGHVRMFAEHAADDPRIGQLVFAIAPDFETRWPGAFAALAALSPKIAVDPLAPEVAEQCRPPRSPWQRGRARAEASRRLLQRHPGHLVFHSLFDQALIGLLARPGAHLRRAGGILHAPPNDPGRPPSRRDRVMMAAYRIAALAGGPKLMSFDDVFIARHAEGLARGWTLTPDPLPLNPAQAARLAAAPGPAEDGRRRFLLFGSLGERKGLSRILDAFERLPPEDRARVSLRLVGQLAEYRDAAAAEAIRARIARLASGSGGHVSFDERFASDDDLIAELIAADAVLTVYDHHKGVSNALYWAAAAGRPVISQDTGYLGAAVLRHGLGLVCDPADPAAIAGALRMAAEPGWTRGFDPDRLRAWSGERSTRAFCTAIVTAMCEQAARA